MGAGASAGVAAGVRAASDKDLKAAFDTFGPDEKKKMAAALASIDQGASGDPVKLAETSHSAVLFIKPHAVTDAVKEFVKKSLDEKGMTVESEGTIKGEDIDSKGLIDTHYGSIAARCVRQAPSELVIQDKGQAEFEKVFGKKWTDALAEGIVYNGKDAAAKLGVSTAEISSKFDALEKGVEQCKLGGGCYAGKVGDIFVINGFYFRMRAAFTEPGKVIYFYVVKWDASKLSWADFRGKVLGATDPAAAAEGSVRAGILKDWEKLGLQSKPDTGNNGVHGSASPFEGLAEKGNWLGTPIENDYFAKALVSSGVSIDTVKEWTKDPTVKFEGKESSVFDLFEDMDGKPLLAKAKAIVG